MFTGVAEVVVEFLTWDSHVSSFAKKVSSAIAVIGKIKPFVPVSRLIIVLYLDFHSTKRAL